MISGVCVEGIAVYLLLIDLGRSTTNRRLLRKSLWFFTSLNPCLGLFPRHFTSMYSHAATLIFRYRFQQRKRPQTNVYGLECGGEWEIRTLDTLPYTHFPGVLLQPLGQLTESLKLLFQRGANLMILRKKVKEKNRKNRPLTIKWLLINWLADYLNNQQPCMNQTW